MSNEIYGVIDLEFYRNKTKLFNIKQIGLIVFDDDYKIHGRFERTIIVKEDIVKSKDKLLKIFDCLDGIFIWGGAQDIKYLKSIGINLEKYQLLDIQPFFNINLGKDNNTLGATYKKLFNIQAEGVHNAIVDCYYTYEIIKEFDFIKSYYGIQRYLELVKEIGEDTINNKVKPLAINPKLEIVDKKKVSGESIIPVYASSEPDEVVQDLNDAKIANRDKVGEDLSDEDLLLCNSQLSSDEDTKKIALEKIARTTKKLEEERKLIESNENNEGQHILQINDLKNIDKLPTNKIKIFQQLSMIDLIDKFSITEKQAIELKNKLNQKGYPLAPLDNCRVLENYFISKKCTVAGNNKEFLIYKNPPKDVTLFIEEIANEYFDSENIRHNITRNQLYGENVGKKAAKKLRKSFVSTDISGTAYKDMSKLLKSNKISNFLLLKAKNPQGQIVFVIRKK